MTDGEFLKADYLTQLNILHEWNEVKAIMRKHDIQDFAELDKALRQSQIKARILTKVTIGDVLGEG